MKLTNLIKSGMHLLSIFLKYMSDNFLKIRKTESTGKTRLENKKDIISKNSNLHKMTFYIDKYFNETYHGIGFRKDIIFIAHIYGINGKEVISLMTKSSDFVIDKKKCIIYSLPHRRVLQCNTKPSKKEIRISKVKLKNVFTRMFNI